MSQGVHDDLKITEAEYDAFLDSVDPDDIKELWDLTCDRETTQALFQLHDQAKDCLEYFGRKEFTHETIDQLARFINNLRDFQDTYEDRLETNQTLLNKLNAFLEKVPESLWLVIDELEPAD